MVASTTVLLLAIFAGTFAIKWEPGWQLNCAKCASLGDDEYCVYPAKTFYDHPGNRALCHHGCIHIQGTVSDPESMNEEWRQRLTHVAVERGLLPSVNNVPYVDGQTRPPATGFIERMMVTAFLSGRKVELKVCAAELEPRAYFFGCQAMSVGGIDGTVCRCGDVMCNQYSLDTLIERIDESGQMRAQETTTADYMRHWWGHRAQ